MKLNCSPLLQTPYEITSLKMNENLCPIYLAGRECDNKLRYSIPSALQNYRIPFVSFQLDDKDQESMIGFEIERRIFPSYIQG